MKKILSVIICVITVFTLFSFSITANATSQTRKAGVVTLSSGWLNIRSSGSSSAQSIGKFQNGDYVTLISKSGAWWYIEYSDGKFGYCSATYLKEVSSQTKYVNITSGSLNIRNGAGSTYDKIGTLQKNETVLVLGKSDNWSKILFDGNRIGYVSTWYLSDSVSVSDTIKLNVPSYKQTDSRWANVTLGSSGKRIADIGCATTGIAMMESFRLGYTIYPDAMSKRLKYTSSGSVYWPSNYTAVTNKTDYLNNILKLLKSGKPVLFGAKNRNGGQHWVVIIGFTGSDTLSASKFIVNDPGSKDRTTLQDLLNTHPNFYKYFYY